MFFYLTTLCLQKFTSEDAPEVPKETSDKEHFMIVEAWKYSNFLCRNYILSGLIVNDVFEVAVIIEKLPPMWKDFKSYLKHKHKEMTVEDLIV
ncbi:putative transcription factor MYB21-like [Capsicum annuum]|nr:putative transcription factor MYB21-like [Capsicum annuum]